MKLSILLAVAVGALGAPVEQQQAADRAAALEDAAAVEPALRRKLDFATAFLARKKTAEPALRARARELEFATIPTGDVEPERMSRSGDEPGQAMCTNGAPPGFFKSRCSTCDETASGGASGAGWCQCWKLPGIIPPDFPDGTGYINPHDVNPHDGTKGTWHDGCGCGALLCECGSGHSAAKPDGTEYTTGCRHTGIESAYQTIPASGGLGGGLGGESDLPVPSSSMAFSDEIDDPYFPHNVAPPPDSLPPCDAHIHPSMSPGDLASSNTFRTGSPTGSCTSSCVVCVSSGTYTGFVGGFQFYSGQTLVGTGSAVFDNSDNTSSFHAWGGPANAAVHSVTFINLHFKNTRFDVYGSNWAFRDVTFSAGKDMHGTEGANQSNHYIKFMGGVVGGLVHRCTFLRSISSRGRGIKVAKHTDEDEVVVRARDITIEYSVCGGADLDAHGHFITCINDHGRGTTLRHNTLRRLLDPSSDYADIVQDHGIYCKVCQNMLAEDNLIAGWVAAAAGASFKLHGPQNVTVRRNRMFTSGIIMYSTLHKRGEAPFPARSVLIADNSILVNTAATPSIRDGEQYTFGPFYRGIGLTNFMNQDCVLEGSYESVRIDSNTVYGPNSTIYLHFAPEEGHCTRSGVPGPEEQLRLMERESVFWGNGELASAGGLLNNSACETIIKHLNDGADEVTVDDHQCEFPPAPPPDRYEGGAAGLPGKCRNGGSFPERLVVEGSRLSPVVVGDAAECRGKCDSHRPYCSAVMFKESSSECLLYQGPVDMEGNTGLSGFTCFRLTDDG
jgi:hypothetical protein